MHFPGWNVVRRLGSGAHASVFVVRRDLMGTIESETTHQAQEDIVFKVSLDERTDFFIEREKKILAFLPHSHHLPTYIPLEIEYQRSIIALQLFGRSISRQILSAIDEFHENGFIHCDVKSNNILFKEADPTFSVVLIDFGFSIPSTESKQKTTSITLHLPQQFPKTRYTSVSVHEDQLPTTRDDIWGYDWKGEKTTSFFESISRMVVPSPPDLKYPNVVPIPGSKNQERILENLGGGKVKLSDEDFKRLEEGLNAREIAGHRGIEETQHKSFGDNWSKK
ncbi:hypothetical protein BLNAU_9486 [Blattamonas nauphoetae]|uniref:non-specific serine/threonine protein kinase n=1 Tax=Blattamonas nauphoetae TaxID=2049346 RepID=A0ABQ9XVX7_9EUKA|nr:hypothetical protein BLNAU_9486 [Blattamonas nauphoetae]